MTRYRLSLALAIFAGALASTEMALAIHPKRCAPIPSYGAYVASQQQLYTRWHGDYYNYSWAGPVPLVCPPTAGHQTKWSWGVTNTEVTPIYTQFRRPYPGAYGNYPGQVGFLPTPRWPSSTDQFGIYYVRGPW